MTKACRLPRGLRAVRNTMVLLPLPGAADSAPRRSRSCTTQLRPERRLNSQTMREPAPRELTLHPTRVLPRLANRTATPFSPFSPLAPSLPLTPFLPLTPSLPSVPFVPSVASVPSVPFVPLAPLAPLAPSEPF